MSLVRRAARGALAVLALGLLVPGCVRLYEPDAFSCLNDSDCLASEHCSQERLVCVADGSCDADSDCSTTQTCTDGSCVAAQCYEGGPASCGRFECDIYQRTCYKDCTAPAYHCSQGSVCHGNTCVARPELPNGTPCELSEDCGSRICCVRPTSQICSNICAPLGSACAASSECANGYCCPTASSNMCSPSPCAGGATCVADTECDSRSCVAGVCAPKLCSADLDCGFGWCAGGACETVPRKPGEACSADRWCASGECRGSVCHGNGGLDAACTTDNDCATGRSCCPNATGRKGCSVTNQGCDGGNGDSCATGGNAACLSGLCLGKTLCSALCKTDADCGLSPWSSRNYCMQNSLGNNVCFPGCAANQNCIDHLGTHFYCAEKTTLDLHKAAVCSGDLYQDYAVQLP